MKKTKYQHYREQSICSGQQRHQRLTSSDTSGGCDPLGKKNDVYCLSGNESDEMSDSSASGESK